MDVFMHYCIHYAHADHPNMTAIRNHTREPSGKALQASLLTCEDKRRSMLLDMLRGHAHLRFLGEGCIVHR